MLTPAELREMKALTKRVVEQGSVSREDWANLVALTLIYQGDETVTAIAAEGFDTFVARAAPVYEGHAFHRDDFERIYRRVCDATARVVRDRVH